MGQHHTPGTLWVIAMPLGNMGDLSPRARSTLEQVEHVACEDTRSAAQALSSLGIKPPRLISLFEHNESRKVGAILQILRDGHDVALISEAGTPTISDPGFRLVCACLDEDLPVSPVPGPSAAIAALSASGLPSDRFLFVGFPPRKKGKLNSYLDDVCHPARTAICYVPARRLPEVVSGVADRAPQARLVLARELTKRYEQFLRGTPGVLLEHFDADPPRGECTLLVYVAAPGRTEQS